MKHLIFVMFLMFLSNGCNIIEQDSNQNEIKDIEVIDKILKPGQVFIYNLGSLGDEEQALIKEDSEHAVMSEIAREFDEFATVEYRYQSKNDFTGKDTVVLEVRRGSDGASPNREIYITVLHLHIQPS